MTVLLGNDISTNVDSFNFVSQGKPRYRKFAALADGTITTISADIVDEGDSVGLFILDTSNNVLAFETIDSTIDGLNTVTLSTPLAVTSGTEYKIGICGSSYTKVRQNDAIPQGWDMAGSFTWPNLPDPLVKETGGTLDAPLLYASASSTPDPTPDASLTDIDGDNDVFAGQTNVIITGDDLGTPTTVTLGGEPLTIV